MMQLLRLGLAAGILLVWQVVAKPLDIEFFISTPVAIGSSWLNSLMEGSLLFHVGITSLEAD